MIKYVHVSRSVEPDSEVRSSDPIFMITGKMVDIIEEYNPVVRGVGGEVQNFKDSKNEKA